MSDKTVFVTVGTTKFDDLITTVLSRAVLEALSARGYKHLILQIGNSDLKPDCTARYGFRKIETFGLSPSIGECASDKSTDIANFIDKIMGFR
ncbi:Uncharacterized protein DBV15_02387 [Temnothorax longispinosus]|uniref:UDP-N-acetylglucosamine transferase subunit ALG13 n=1 Tax=Temnothorax longispinosus TaxID=300112 RepID=A0A4S2JSJ2_9HYME|nr:Uncharacterized protein DBV15_02387 [Temnothorax longispinosus]